MPTTLDKPIPAATITIAAKLLAEDLREPPRTIKYLARIVGAIGIEQSAIYLSKAQKLYEAGTLLTKDGTRKRSLGGTFFHLVRQDYPELGQNV